MRATIVSEWRKATATSLWWWLGIGAALYMAMMAGLFGFTFSLPMEEGGMGADGLDSVAGARTVYGITPAMGYVFPLVLGALSVTNEFRHRTITSTLLAQPSRGRVVTAKLITQAGMGAVMGVFGTLGAMVAGGVTLQLATGSTMLGEPAVWETIGLSILAMSLWGLVGVGIGSLIPNQIASILVILAFTQFVEPIARVVLMAIDGLGFLASYLPGAAGEALAGGSIYSASGMSTLLSQPVGGLVLLAYGLVLSLIGWATTLRRDVT